jgi:hypothetical protein
MRWVAFKLFASGVLDAVLRGLSAAFNWLSADWRNLALAISWGALLWSQFVIVPGLRDQIARRDGQIIRVTIERDAEAAAHLGTVNAFLTASRQAQKDAEANAQRVAREQETITDETLSNRRNDRAAVRARFDRLRARDAARADPGSADAAGLPGVPDAAGRAAAAPADQNLRPTRADTGDLAPQPACPAGLVCMTPGEAETASEDAHDHDRLIDWLVAQAAVRFTPEEPRR